MATTTIQAELRTGTGTSQARALRRGGWVPGNMNLDGGGNKALRLNRHAFEQMLRHHASESVLVDLAIAGEDKPRKALLKEVQHDTVNGAILHADFLEVSMTRKMRASVSVRLAGDPVGVMLEGGILEQFLHELDVECLPGDLVEEIVVDVSGLHLGQAIPVGEIKVPAGLTIVTGAQIPMCSVLAPQKEEETAAAAEGAEAAATTAEPEVIKKGKDEKEGEAAPAGKDAAKAPAKEEKGKKG